MKPAPAKPPTTSSWWSTPGGRHAWITMVRDTRKLVNLFDQHLRPGGSVKR